MNNIKEIFASLSARLFVYESKTYHDEYVFFNDRDGYFLKPDSIVQDLYKSASLFDVSEVYKEAEFYKARINQILSLLEIAHYLCVNSYGEEETIPLKGKLKTEIEKLRKEELLKYLTCLETIQKSNSLRDDNTFSSNVPKIQWLGKTNVLATLFYDLLNGQDKGKGVSTTPLLKAEKKDLINLLMNNFLDSKGNPLSEVTLSDYLNKSKPETKAKIGARIELNH